MGNEKKLRLIRVAKEFKIGLNTVTDFLQKKGIKIDEAPNTLVDQTIYAILEEKFGANRSVGSTRISAHQRREEFDNLKVGSVIAAVISKIEPTFVLAEFGGLHGIIHKSELFAGNIRDMGVYFNIGDEIQAKVLSKEIEDGKPRIRLGVPDTLGDEAWHDIESRYQLNNIYQGVVIAVAEEGVYVKLEKYVETLIPACELKWERTGGDSELHKIGQKLNILLTRIDVCGKIMEASVRMLTPDPWQVAASEFKHDQIIPVRVTGEKGKYLFVETDDNLKLCGRISLSEISWVYKYNELPEDIKPKQGCVVEAKIVILQPEKRKMELSIRQTEHNPWADISVGAQVWGDIGPSNEDGTTTVYLECGLSASTKDINLTTNMGEHIPFKVIECNKIGQQIIVSHNRWVHDKETDRIIRNFFNPQTLL